MILLIGLNKAKEECFFQNKHSRKKILKGGQKKKYSKYPYKNYSLLSIIDMQIKINIGKTNKNNNS